jgi:hypothetical protein
MGTTNEDLSHSINCSHCSFNRLIPTICQEGICAECGNDHSFRGNFEDAITFIDLLPELFPEIFKNYSSSKLQGFEN